MGAEDYSVCDYGCSGETRVGSSSSLFALFVCLVVIPNEMLVGQYIWGCMIFDPLSRAPLGRLASHGLGCLPMGKGHLHAYIYIYIYTFTVYMSGGGRTPSGPACIM